MKPDTDERSNSGESEGETLNSLPLQFSKRSHKQIQLDTLKLMARKLKNPGHQMANG
jgi:hypothetical protein